MKRLKILFVTEYFPPHIGGVETFFYELRKALIKKGHHVDVVTSSQPGAPFKEKDDGGTIYRITVPQSVDRYAFTFLAFPKVMKLAGSADIIHCTTYNSIPSAWFASKIRRKKTILSVHEVLGKDFGARTKGKPLKTSILRFLEWSLLQFHFDHTVAVSKATQNDLPRKHRKRSSVIYHGIDPLFSPRETHKDNEKKTFLYFGRTAAQKGFWFLLENLPKFYESEDMQEKVRFRLIITGSKADRQKVKAFLIKKKLDKFVDLQASVPRAVLPDAIKDSDGVIVPSFAEGFGFTAAEACQCRVPVLSSDAGSLPEVVSGKHLMFESGNSKSLLKNLKRAARGQWNYKKPHKFSWEKAAEQFEELYLDLI